MDEMKKKLKRGKKGKKWKLEKGKRNIFENKQMNNSIVFLSHAHNDHSLLLHSFTIICIIQQMIINGAGQVQLLRTSTSHFHYRKNNISSILLILDFTYKQMWLVGLGV